MSNYNLSKIYYFPPALYTQRKSGKWIFKQGIISFICPSCGLEDLIESPDYEVNSSGAVYPIFVCREVKCKFTARIGLVNHKKIVSEGG